MKNYLCDSDIPNRLHVYEQQQVFDKSGWASGLAGKQVKNNKL